MPNDSTTYPRALSWLPAVAVAALLVAAACIAILAGAFDHAALPFASALSAPSTRPADAAPSSSASAPNRGVLAATGNSICAATDGCVSYTLLDADLATWHGRPAWAAAYRVVMRSGLRMTVYDWVDPASGQPLELADISR